MNKICRSTRYPRYVSKSTRRLPEKTSVKNAKTYQEALDTVAQRSLLYISY